MAPHIRALMKNTDRTEEKWTAFIIHP